MSILTKLQNGRVGLIELIFMGFNVYFKNLKSILLAFCTIYLPLLIFFSALAAHMQQDSTNVSVPFLVLSFVLLFLYIFAIPIYFIAVAVITENYVKGITTNYQRVVNKVFSSLVTLLLLSLRFSIMYILRCLLLLIPAIVLVNLIVLVTLSLISGSTNVSLINQYSDIAVAVAVGAILSVLFTIPVIIYLINNQYYGLAFILRDKKGTDAFHYSQSLVKSDWWRVFGFAILGSLCGIINMVLQVLLSKILSLLIAELWADLLSQVLPQLIAIGISVASILLFLNLDFQKSLDS